MNFVKNPYTMCEKLYNLVHDLTGQLKDMIAQKVYDPRGKSVSQYTATNKFKTNTTLPTSTDSQ